jgi:hypothetical protein
MIAQGTQELPSIQGPAGLTRGDLMDRWEDATPVPRVERGQSGPPCDLCHCRIRTGQRMRAYAGSSLTPRPHGKPPSGKRYVCHEICFQHWKAALKSFQRSACQQSARKADR